MSDRQGIRVTLTGRVQGVGMRPALYRSARAHSLSGEIRNDGDGVTCELQGLGRDLDAFLGELDERIPRHARIDELIVISVAAAEPADRLSVVGSVASASAARCPIPPDLATCRECLAEMRDPGNRRLGHPFISCTSCGPRYSIALGLPWDRERTTMRRFPMCEACAAEYHDPGSRRYHAETICCNDCGPMLSASPGGGAPLATAVRALLAGGVVALKGVGGYHLLCLADDERAIARIRREKARPERPLAVMGRNLYALGAMCEIDSAARLEVAGAAAPIVVVPARPGVLPSIVAPRLSKVGVMLPYSPVHHLLFDALPPEADALVVTSANRRGEPLVYRDADARRLEQMANILVGHDREISLPVDDSVLELAAGRCTLRLGRGLLPAAVPAHGAAPRLVALGADGKATITVSSNAETVVWARVGEVAGAAGEARLAELAARVEAVVAADRPELVADRHPGYVTSRWAAGRGRRVRLVDHHAAHVAAVIAERSLQGPVIGVALDGLGWGPDGTLWGGELFVVEGREFEHAGGFRPFAIPRSDAVARNPAWSARAVLAAAGVHPPGHLAGVELDAVARLCASADRSIATTSAGRLFDAVAAIALRLHQASYEGQAGLELEAAAAGLATRASYRADVGGAPIVIDWRPAIAGLVGDAGVAPSQVARDFHASVAAWIAHAVRDLEARLGRTCQVVATGGVMQNSLLRDDLAAALGDRELAFSVLLPPNDEGLGVGQLVLASD